MRVGDYSRKTLETQISITVNLDGEGRGEIDTGIRFFDHLLNTFATHSLIDVKINAKGDLDHHVAEDVAICLGKALRKAIGDGIGIRRFGHSIVPMDCSLAIASVDLVRRPHHEIDLKIVGRAVEDAIGEDIIHFLETLSYSLEANIHVWIQYGSNDHHKLEASFKALALSFREAMKVDPRRTGIPSSKGTI